MNRNTVLVGILIAAVAVAGGLWAVLGGLPGDAALPSGAVTAGPVERVGNARVYTLDPAQSTAQFTIFEELNGQPNDVVGTTSTLAGQLAVDLNDLSTARLGPVTVNARTLVTDNDRRNGAIRRFILNTDTYEWITFTPTAIAGLTGRAAPGDRFTFDVAGDLTIRAVTRPVVFVVNVRVDSAERLSGTATTTLKRQDFNLTIPSVPQVANVGEEVQLQINGVAVAAP